VIEEVEGENWGHKGTSVKLIREAEAAERAKAAGKKAPAKKAPAKKAPAKRAALGAVPEAVSLKRGPAKKS
jgi:hypothetical protein